MSRSREELTQLTVVELKNALKELGQPVTGKKEELVDRLLAAEQATPGASGDAAPEPAVAAPEPAQPEEASAAEAPATDAPAEEPAAEAPKDDGKRARIVFSDEAVKAMPAQITVIHSVELAKPIKSDTEKLKDRADRFKDPEIEKAKQRAQRFGVYDPNLEKEKAKKRAERFGTPNEDLDEERKAKRAARFGIVDPVAKLASRAERFGIAAPEAKAGNGVKAPKTLVAAPSIAGAPISSAEFEAQKKARAARFAAAL